MSTKKFYKRTPTIKTPTVPNITATYLIIVESPSKCTKIEHFLGPDYYCIASKGHIRTIDGLKSIDIKSSFDAKFSIIEEKQAHVDFMKTVLSKFSKENVILATDDDREGEAIAWHICELFELSVATTKRIIFHEITKHAICDAVKNPTIVNMNLVHAQHARQVLDIIVGYKISPFLWKYLFHNKSNSLSAGRCQTPALRLVYDNDKNKDDCIETKYKTTGSFFSKNILFDLCHDFENSEQVLNFLEKTKTFEHRIQIGNTKETKKSAPQPFNTSRLLQVASNNLHISPKETMSLCQKLYQNGYITYMRTESQKYSSDFLKKAESFIVNEWKKPEYMGNVEVLENKDVNNPHEAIRVTHIETKYITCEDGDTSRLSTLYRLIWRNSIESCMSDARYNCIGVKITAPLENEYLHTVEIPLFLGWKKVGEKPFESESCNENLGFHTEKQNEPGSLLLYFQSIEKSEKPINYNYVDSIVAIKNRHQHYTEASLISKLEDLGIGRPSTFATIVDTIQERGYVKRKDLEGEKTKCLEFKLRDCNIERLEKEKVFGNEKNKLVLQPLGLLTVEFLIKHFQQLFSYDYTKIMEDSLDSVSSGKECDWSTICKNCYDEIKELSKPIAKVEKQVYPIDDHHVFVFEKFGPVIRRCNEDGTFEYKPVKKDMKIDLEKLKNKEYSLNELYEIQNDCLGKYQDENVFIKNGKYGPYVEWGEKKESIKKIEKPLDMITLDDIIELLESKDEKKVDKSVLRVVTPNLSIRRGKFGPYAFYKTPNMSKPEFYNIKKFPEGFGVCDSLTLIHWIEKTYNVSIYNK